MTSRLALALPLLCLLSPAAAAADSYRDDPHDERFFFELELDGGFGPRLAEDSAIVGHMALRPRLGLVLDTGRDSDAREALGNAIAIEVPVHLFFNARAQAAGERPDVAVGLAPRALHELVDAPLRVPSVMSIGLPEFGVFIPGDGSEVGGYVGYSHTLSARLNDRDDEVNFALETRISVYFLILEEEEGAVGTLSLGLTVY